MLIAEHDPVDEKPDEAPPRPGGPQEEADVEPLADDCETSMGRWTLHFLMTI